LGSYGIDEALVMGFSILLHRLYRVRVNSEYSDFMPVINGTGIPQGSILDSISSCFDSCSSTG